MFGFNVAKKKKQIIQNHHIIYPDGKNKEVTRKVRKSIHWIITQIRRHNYLTCQEINCIKLECELKRRYNNEHI